MLYTTGMWVLLMLVHGGSGVHPLGTAEFASQEACKSAAVDFAVKVEPYANITWACYSKDTGGH